MRKWETLSHLNRRSKWMIVVCAVTMIAAAILRFGWMGKIPSGVHIDEAGMAYDAYCISNFGVDRYLMRYPVYFINFGGGQNALYGYLCAILIKLIGLNVYAIRIPAAIMGMVTVIVGALIVREQFGNKEGLAAAILLTICPFYIMQSHIGLESDLMLSFSILSIYTLVKAVKKESGYGLFLLSGIFWGLTLYTYAVSYIVIPIFLILSVIYLFYVKKLNWKKLLVFGIPITVLAMPLILMVLINTFDLPQINTRLFTIPRLPVYRGAEITWDKIKTGLWQIWQHFFLEDGLTYNSMHGFYTLYLISIPFCIWGMISSIIHSVKYLRKREFGVTTIVTFFFLAEFIMGVLTGDNINKINAVYFPLMFFLIAGLFDIGKRIPMIAGKRIFAGVVGIIYLICFILFFRNYFLTDYTKTMSYYTKNYTTIAGVLEQLPELIKGRECYIYDNAIFYLIANPIAPYELEDVNQMKTDINIGNLHFYLPGEFKAEDVVILRDDSEARVIWENPQSTGIAYQRMEINDYVVYYTE